MGQYRVRRYEPKVGIGKFSATLNVGDVLDLDDTGEPAIYLTRSGAIERIGDTVEEIAEETPELDPVPVEEPVIPDEEPPVVDPAPESEWVPPTEEGAQDGG